MDNENGAEDDFPRDWSLVAWGENGKAKISVTHENKKLKSKTLPYIQRRS